MFRVCFCFCLGGGGESDLPALWVLGACIGFLLGVRVPFRGAACHKVL